MIRNPIEDRGDGSNIVSFVILGGSARVSYSYAMTYSKNDAKKPATDPR
jgi:hypothetical protein